MPEFTENLRGAKTGEVKEFPVTYPAEYPQKTLAGKTFSYHVEIQSIKRKVVPPADDELAKSVSEFASLEELRTKVGQDLAEEAKRHAEMDSKQKLAEKLLEANRFPVPEVLVEAQLDRKLERTVGQLMSQGIDPRQTQVDWKKVREEARPEAEKEVRVALTLSRVAEAEKIDRNRRRTGQHDSGDGAGPAHHPGGIEDALDTRREAGYTEVYSPKSKSAGLHIPQRENHSEKCAVCRPGWRESVDKDHEQPA